MTAPVMIMAGGTGGHIFPALAVADCLRQRDVPVIWLGSKGGMENRLVPAAGFHLVALSVRGLRGKGALALAFAPFKLLWSVTQALAALLRYRPRAVLGLGGFASGPGGLAAWLLRRPLYIHEQNAIPGMTNRWLSRLSRGVMEAFPGSFRHIATHASVLHVGNPVRESIVQIPDASVRLAGRSGPIHLFVMGGSLGALKLNEIVPKAMSALGTEVKVWHQTGERHLDATRLHYAEAGVDARISAFIDDMAEAYAWADLVIARAGALTVSELTQVGVAAILVPYPHAVDDHQTANADVLVKKGAAVLVADKKLTTSTLQNMLADLTEDRSKLMEMSLAAAELKRPKAAQVVAEVCLGERDVAHSTEASA
jgi:UDP-N-acetylglucosamine--N-acetylmuramyl-(pentapeptide) pyrophosphoryl-undecaprenol N-acetylglucosamine transferase